MKQSSLFTIGILTLTLAACTEATDTPPVDTDATTSEDTQMQETKNVLYRGQLQEAGVSIFMQGTHRLVLDDGRFVLLESEAVDLDDYLGQQVEVFGSVRPTTEQGGMIMRVESVLSLEASSSSSSESSVSSVSSESSLPAVAPAGVEGGESSVSSESSTETAEQPAITSSATATWEASGELTAKAAIMANDKMEPENWTQQYCSSHIGFCIPVHKNWWFKSFGATTSALWHLEIGPTEMNNLGEGPITVRLVSGSTSADGQVQVTGGEVTGMRSWTGDRHFEVRGPANLEAAIRYITAQLKSSGQ